MKEIPWYIGKDIDYVAKGWGTEEVATSFVLNWDVVWEKVVKDYVTGNWYPRNLYFVGMEDRMMTENGMIPSTDLSQGGRVGVDGISAKAKAALGSEILAQIQLRREQIISGKWDPFMKEIVDRDTGEIVSPEGDMPDDEYLLTQMDYFVEGIEGPLR